MEYWSEYRLELQEALVEAMAEGDFESAEIYQSLIDQHDEKEH
jgi:hypothetical protein